jgi:hypothetical protein
VENEDQVSPLFTRQDESTISLFLGRLGEIADDELIREELQITDKQIEELSRCLTSYRNDMEEAIRKRPRLVDPITNENEEAIKKAHLQHLAIVRSIQSRAIQSVQEILLDHQIVRLKQIALQAEIHGILVEFR